MKTPRGVAPAVAVVGALLVAAAADRWAPAPAADVGRGSEEAFAAGLHLREIPPGGRPQRWTGPRARVDFLDVPAGAAELDVALRGHRGTVVVALDGVVLGTLPPGRPHAVFPLTLRQRGAHEVELRAEAFTAGDGRTLGTLLERVSLRHAPARAPSLRLLALFAAPALVAAVAARAAGMAAPAAGAAGLLAALLQAALLWPHGLLRAPYATRLAVLLGAASLAAAAFARLSERRASGAGRWAFAALGAALTVQLVLAASPVMVVSDAVFHANNLGRVARGELFLTSVTQHAQPFRFPYGVSFYLPLAPLARAGLDPVALVRWGAALSAVAASAALFGALLRASSAARAGLTVVLLQLLPVTLDVFSHGNLSNVFGQSATTGFFAWWVGGMPGGWWLGAGLLALGCLGHFSSLVVLSVLAAALALAWRGSLGRTRGLALAAGLGLAGLYYARFLPMIVEQVPRLLEGGGQGRGASRGAWAALRLQGLGLLAGLGPPALVLSWIGRPRPARGPLERALTAYWLAALVLAALAVVSPVETRYLYALTVPVAAAAAQGALGLWQRGTGARVAAAVLIAVQAALAAGNAAEALLQRYR